MPKKKEVKVKKDKTPADFRDKLHKFIQKELGKSSAFVMIGDHPTEDCQFMIAGSCSRRWLTRAGEKIVDVADGDTSGASCGDCGSTDCESISQLRRDGKGGLSDQLKKLLREALSDDNE